MPEGKKKKRTKRGERVSCCWWRGIKEEGQEGHRRELTEKKKAGSENIRRHNRREKRNGKERGGR